jgi:hypothetical protein
MGWHVAHEKTVSKPITANRVTLKTISFFLVADPHFTCMMTFKANCLLINADQSS